MSIMEEFIMGLWNGFHLLEPKLMCKSMIARPMNIVQEILSDKQGSVIQEQCIWAYRQQCGRHLGPGEMSWNHVSIGK